MTGFYATIARYYDSEHHDKTEDLPLYAELAEQHGDPILVVGAGTGRVMLHLAQLDYTLHGIESERAMLERAHAKLAALPALAERVVFHEGDALKVALDARFKLVIIPYNTLMHFHAQVDQLALLKRIRGWLEPDGALIIDLPNAGEAYAGLDSGAVTLERTFLDLDTGHLVMQHSVSELDRATQMMRVTWIYDEITGDGVVKRTVAPVVNRYFFYPEIRLLLSQTGFNDVQVFGDVDYAPFEDGCPRMVVVAG